ncbi:hypothetical protein B0W48_03155 [Pseudoalteromonas aliena]|uniref:Uncharacterized protein n=1 Tax=Pseudoalteromonas aliena TaxID=247523 RepID=A0A1Q2GV60_9GAMM|nr:hypothetical protein [Pseudoalteromonas aliena]AQP98880.1 hypothetical protein B0W48_03155 [Pseudoalteromonas aliena]
MNKKKFVIALLVWFVGLPLSIAVSYILRIIGDYNSLGMPEVVWFIMHISLYILSIILAYFSLQKLSFAKKLTSMVMISFVYAVYYFGLTWLYIIESGIDSV